MRDGFYIGVKGFGMNMNAGKRGNHFLLPSVLEISQVVKSSQCLGEIDKTQSGMENAAHKADDEGRGEGARLVWHGADVTHELRSEVDCSGFGLIPRILSRGGRTGWCSGTRAIAREWLSARRTVERVHGPERYFVATGVLQKVIQDEVVRRSSRRIRLL